MLVGAPRAAAAAVAAWRYVDRARTHDVRLEHDAARRTVAILERADGASVEERIPIARPWETRVAVWLLEARLAQLGEYWRAQSGLAGWSRVLRPAGAPLPDARPNEALRPAGATLLHHYHDERAGDDRLLAALGDACARYTVVRASLDVDALEVGRVDVVHARLSDALARSVVLREQMALTQLGLGKLVTRDDYARAFGRGGDERAERLVEEVVARVRDGGAPRALLPEPDDVYDEFLLRIQDPRLLALHRRYLHAGEEDDLLAGGAVVIRKAIGLKRTLADHREQHLLTILEASLLAREKLRSGRLARGDPEVRALTRLAYYL